MLSRRTRIAFWSLGGVAALLGVLLLAAVVGRYALTTEGGRAFLVEQIEGAASGPDLKLAIGAMEGDPFDQFTLRNVRVGDAEGDWLVLEDVSADWSPWALIGGRLDVSTLDVLGASISRFPQGGGEEQPSSGFALPKLPLDIVVSNFNLQRINLAEAAVGTNAQLAAEGSIGLIAGEQYRLSLSGRRTDQEAGSLNAELDYVPGSGTLDMDIALDAPAGGVITNLLGVPGRPALSLQATGSGAADDWDGVVRFLAGDATVLDIDITGRTADEVLVSLEGRVDPRPMVELPLLDEMFNVSGRLRYGAETLTIDAIRLEGPPASLRLFGSVDLSRSVLDILFQVRPRDAERLAALVAPLEIGESAVDGRLSGPFEQPVLSFNILADSVGVSGVTASNLNIALSAERVDGGISLSGTGGMADLSYEGTEIAATPGLLFDGLAAGDFSSLDIERLDISAEKGRLHAEGMLGLSAGTLDIRTSLNLPPGMEGEQPLMHLLAPGLDLSAHVQQAAGEPLVVEDIALRHPWVEADGRALSQPDEALELADISLSVTDVAALAGVFGVEASGAPVNLTARVSGEWAAPRLSAEASAEDLTAAGVALSQLGIAVDLQPTDAGGFSGHVEGEANSPLGQNTLSLDYALPGEGPVALSAVAFGTGSGTLTGELMVPRDGSPLTGRLSGPISFTDADLPVSGTAHTRLVLGNEGGKQTAALNVGGEDLRAGSAEFTQASLTVRQEGDNIDFDLEGTGAYLGPVSLSGSGRIVTRRGDESLRLQALNLGLGAEQISLAEPMLIRLPEGGIEIPPFGLTVGDGRIDVGLVQQPNNLSLDLDLSDVPLDLLRNLDFPLTTTGRLSGSVQLRADAESASGSVDLSVGDLMLRGARASIRNMAGDITGDWDGERLSLNADISGADGDMLAMRGDLPLRYQPDNGSLSLADDAPLSLEFAWQGEVAPLWQAAGSDADFLAGLLDADVTISGTLAAPEIDGRVALQDGRYQNVDTGTKLQDMEALVRLSPGSAVVERVSATDGHGGSMSANGSLSYGPDTPVDVALDLTFEKMRAIARPEVTATVSGDLQYRLEDKKGTLSGDLVTDEIEARLVAPEGEEVVVLDVVEEPAPLHPTPEADTDAESNPPMQLDISVDIPGRFFIRGRGLDSEWEGELEVSGPADEFIIVGGVNVLRGIFEFNGRRFNLTTGNVQFSGEQPINPQVSIRAEHDADELTAIISISGRPDSLNIGFSSNPALPEDEVVAHVLFGKGVANLSAYEAVQLAMAMRSLSSGGEGITGIARGAVGLDTLSFGSGEEGGAVVRGGKYITDDVYLEVQTGTKPGSDKVGVQVDITNNLSVETEVRQEKGSSVGLFWRKDY